MADTLEQPLDVKQRIAHGLVDLIPGSPDPLHVSGLSQGALNRFLDLSKQDVSNNAGAGSAPAGGFFSRLFGNQREAIPGAKDNALSLIDRYKQNPAAFTDSQDVLSAQALIGSAYGPLDDDWETISAEEGNYLSTLQEQLRSGVSLSALFNQNYQDAEARLAREQELEAERLAAEREASTRHAEVTGTLYQSGYLDAGDIDDPKAVAVAMNKFIVGNSPMGDWASEQDRIFGGDFENWTPSPYASVYLRRETAGMHASRLKADLEGNDETRIRLAQGYLSLQGYEGIQINGVVDKATFAAGTAEIQKPLALPEDIVVDGRVDPVKLSEMAVHGQLLLPAMDEQSLSQYLSPEDAEIAMMYPTVAERGDAYVVSRESFVAARMIGDDPSLATYNAFLAAENAKRAGQTLDAQISLPPVAVPVDATIEEEIMDIAQNPAVLIDNERGDAFMDASQPIVDGIKEHAIGETDRMGIVVFGNKEVALEGIVEALRLDQGRMGDGNADNLIRLDGAINLVRGSVAVEDLGITGAAIPPSPDDVWAINESMGYDKNHRFDLTNPVEMQAVLKGVIIHQNVKAAGVPFTQDFIAEHGNIDRPDVEEATAIAAGVKSAPAAPAPAEPATPGPTLRGNFDAMAEGRDATTPVPGTEPGQRERVAAFTPN